jgi:hypothetical protein
MAQLKAYTTISPTAEDVLFNVSLIREDTLAAIEGGSEFYVREQKYEVTEAFADVEDDILNYDCKVVIPLQVVSIDGGVIGAEVNLLVDKIEFGYERGDNTLLVTRNQGFLQSWIVSDTLAEIEALANAIASSGGELILDNLVVRGTITVVGNASIGGDLAVTGSAEVGVDLDVTGVILSDGLTAINDVVVGGELGVTGPAEFSDDVTMLQGLAVTNPILADGGVVTPIVDAAEGEALSIGETNATDITTGAVGFVSDATKIATYILPGEQTLTDGTEQELSLVGITYLEAGDIGTATGTLLDGVVVGQTKKIWMTVTGGGLWQVTHSSVYTITFTNQGEWITLIWNGSEWRTVDKGLCDGAPVVGVS